MKTTTVPTTKTLLAAAIGLALALSGAAYSGDAGESEASTDARVAQTTTRTAPPEGSDSAPARLVAAEFNVDGMTCGGCALATEMSVKNLEGVKSADAEYDEGRCTVKSDPSAVDTDWIAVAIEDAGFTPTLKSTD